MRALILYPTNALVNDQLTRLRHLFGDAQLASWFRQRYNASRPVRFGMYTSRTPYPGPMSNERNQQQLLPLLDYYLQLEAEQSAQTHELRAHGRWPACDLAALRTAALAGKTHVGGHDYELYTRHQMRQWCPDILITNYSMLEYMLMRPIERAIFAQTAAWLASDTANTLLIVLDEAHLYSGVTGAEIALLLRRLQARLGIDRERTRYILTSASLDTGNEEQSAVMSFATALAGMRSGEAASFALIQGQHASAPAPAREVAHTPDTEAQVLAALDLPAFTYRATDPTSGHKAIAALAARMGWPAPPAPTDIPRYLGQQLPSLRVFCRLWALTTGHAQAFSCLAESLFPMLDELERAKATSALLALAAAAIGGDEQPLLPVRAHLLFRGLPPLYACINPRCNARHATDGSSGELGALWLSPRLHCSCGGRVYEVYAHRNCGALFLRVFAPSEPATFYWHEPGDVAGPQPESGDANRTATLLLIGQPHPGHQNNERIWLHIATGRVLLESAAPTAAQGSDVIPVYRPTLTPDHSQHAEDTDADDAERGTRRWKSCPVCRKRLHRTAFTSLSTKGDQPFVNLVRRQFELQPPSVPARDAAPNMGRKVLLFSDGRQRAARLARDLPREVELDTFRQALLLAVHERSHRTGQAAARMDTALYRKFVAVCACYRLHFFDGDSQAALLRQIQEFRENYESNITLAEEYEWEPAIPQGYRRALLRQVADRLYSMQRMCAAVVEPTATSLHSLKRKTIFARLDEPDLRALTIHWINALLEQSAFDANITPTDRQQTVPGEGFAASGNGTLPASWNEAEKAAEAVLGYCQNELPQIRIALLDELCEVKERLAFLKPEKLALRLTLEDSWYQCGDCAQLIWLPLRGQCPNPRCGSTHLMQLPDDDQSLRARTDFYREPIRQAIAGTRAPMHLTAEEHTAQLSYRDSQHVSTTTEQYELRFQDIGISAERPAIDILSCTTTMEVGVDIGALLGIGLRTMPPRRTNYQQRAGRAGRRGAALSTVLVYSENDSHDAHYFAHPDEMISSPVPCPRISPVNERLARRHIQAALIQTFFLEQVAEADAPTAQQGYLAEALGTAQVFFTASGSSNLRDFERWLAHALAGDVPQLAQRIAAWLPDQLDGKPLNTQRKLDLVRAVACTFIANLREVGNQMFPAKSAASPLQPNEPFGPSAAEVTLLDLLFDRGFLPAYAFPREVRSFVIEAWNHGSGGASQISIKQRPQQSIDIALSEYAPGRELIVDKETYRVGGIYVDPFPGATLATRVPSVFQRPRSIFALCRCCGYTHKEETPNNSGAAEHPCPLCHAPLATKELLDPPGFAPQQARPLDPGQVHNDGSIPGRIVTQVQLVIPLTDADDFGYTTADGRVAWSDAEHRALLIANCGVNGEGFTICRSCGAAAPGDPDWLHQAHARPFLVPGWVTAPRKCCSPDGLWQGYLGHTFYSDLLLLRLHWPRGVAHQIGHPWLRDALDTLAQALLLAVTRLLDVATQEIQVGWSYTTAAPASAALHPTPPRMADFFVFDTLSGGAGYATQAGRYIEALLRETQQVLDTCPEDCERSCYRCLRTYSNRIRHHRLDRRLAGTLLRAIIHGHPPATPGIAEQATQLDALRQFLELAHIPCRREDTWHGVRVPLLVESSQGPFAVGAYPIQQDRQVVAHPLDVLPAQQVRLVSDYELTRNLPGIAQSLV